MCSCFRGEQLVMCSFFGGEGFKSHFVLLSIMFYVLHLIVFFRYYLLFRCFQNLIIFLMFCFNFSVFCFQCSLLCCRDCMNIIANREDIFSMSLQGPQGTYVNPNGYVHEAITLYKAKGLILQGRSSTEQSWFPG